MRHRLPYLAVLAALIAESVLLWPPPFALTDHLVLWYAGHIVATGGSPYDALAWLDAAERSGSPHLAELVANGGAARVWPYPPWTSWLFVPYGLLPVEIGAWALHLSYLAAGLSAAWMLSRLVSWSRDEAAALALVVFVAFEPFVIAARWGQFSAFLLLGAALAAVGLTSRRDVPIVLGALLLATKPHVTLFLGLAVVAALLWQRRARSLAIATIVLASVVALAWAREPTWLTVAGPAVADRIAALPRFGSPAALLASIAGSAWPALMVAVTAAVAACCVATLRWTPIGSLVTPIVAIGGVLSLALTPYALVYDQLLLAPAALFAIAALDRARGVARGAYGVAVLLIVIVVPWLAYLWVIRTDTQAVAGVVPLLFAALLVPAAALLAGRPKLAPGEDQRHVAERDGRRKDPEQEGGESVRALPADQRQG